MNVECEQEAVHLTMNNVVTGSEIKGDDENSFNGNGYLSLGTVNRRRHGLGCTSDWWMRDEILVANKEKSKRCRTSRWVKSNLFLILNFSGIVAGLIIGLAVRQANPEMDVLLWIGMPGELYMRILKVIILPLIVCSVIDGTSSTDPKASGRIGIVCLGYIILTNAMATLIGIILAIAIRPGSVARVRGNNAQLDTRNLQTVDIFADFIRNLFPDNIVRATLQVSQTKYTGNDVVTQANISGKLLNMTVTEISRTVGYVDGVNLLGIIVISAVIGITASQAGEKAIPFTSFFRSGTIILFKLFSWMKWTTPVGVASLIAVVLLDVEDIQSALASLGVFIATVSGGNLVYQITFQSLVYAIFTRKNPLRFLASVAKPWVMAVGPPSSFIPMAEMMRISQDTYGVDPRVTDFVLPFSLTLNRNGSSIFISATCLFMAQYAGLSVDIGTVLTIGVLTLMTSLATPSVPSGSVVSILIILGSVGIPGSNIGLVLAVDWLNDRVRTTTNVVGHMLAVQVTWQLCKKKLKEKDRKNLKLATIQEISVF